MSREPPTIIVGAGIVGVCCAAELAKRGHAVQVIDRLAPGAGTSRGNAAGIALAEVLPLASPGVFRQAPKWLLDPLGPLTVAPAYLPRLAPWLWRFWRAGSRAQVRRGAAALAALNRLTWPATRMLYDEAGLGQDLRSIPALHLYETDASFCRSQFGWALRSEMGISFEHMDAGDLRDLEPSLAPIFARATRVTEWAMVSEPYRVARKIAALAKARGAEFLRGQVVAVELAGGKDHGLTVRLEDGRTLSARRLLVAAGAWSHHLAEAFGDRVPLETERGYNTTLRDPGIQVSHQLFFEDHGFVASPLENGFRIGGAVELAGLEAPPNYARSRAMMTKAKLFLPALRGEGGVEWMGYRPSLPDSLPVIDRSPQYPRVFYAFGHGHLGLTQAPATAQILADLVEGRESEFDRTPFRVNRF